MENNYNTVTWLNNHINNIITGDKVLSSIYIKGEISNFKAHTTGHFYFSLKDEKSRIKAIMFKGYTNKLLFTPKDGMNVLIHGSVRSYEAMGEYQIYVDELIEDGVGNLYVAFNELKLKLEKEGLFSKEHKKRIPKMPNTIGIITAQTGAAIRDILNTLERRYPISKTILFPTLVQGTNAAEDIVKNIKRANELNNVDVLIIGRGGGSIEDLWCFNEEIVARAIYESKIPIISAVGHEIDFTISDFVADMRAATPTAAAMLAVPDIVNIIKYLKEVRNRMDNSLLNKVNTLKLNYENLSNNIMLKQPSRLYENKIIQLDNLITKNKNLLKDIYTFNKHRYELLANNKILSNPFLIYENKKDYIDYLLKNISSSLEKNIIIKKSKLDNIKTSYILKQPEIIYEKKNIKLDNLIEKLEVLNPINALKRGYSIIKINNKVVDSTKLKINDNINIYTNKNVINATINKIDKEK